MKFYMTPNGEPNPFQAYDVKILMPGHPCENPLFLSHELVLKLSDVQLMEQEAVLKATAVQKSLAGNVTDSSLSSLSSAGGVQGQGGPGVGSWGG